MKDNKMVYEGSLAIKKGVGTFVFSKNVSTKLDNWSSFIQKMKIFKGTGA